MANRPWCKLVAYNKNSKKNVEVATIWGTDWGRGNVSVVTETDLEGQYPRLSFREAMEKGYGTKEGAAEGRYLNFVFSDPAAVSAAALSVQAKFAESDASESDEFID